MKRMFAPLLGFLLCVLTVQAETPKATRINRAIELLASGQPIYYTGSHEGTDGNFQQGKKDAQTYADYISYDMEHAPFDVKGLADYMKGLAEGGPTKNAENVVDMIKEGVMVGPASQEAAEIGRKFTKRTMPW